MNDISFTIPDEILVSSAKAGDDEAFANIMHQNARKIYTYAFGILKDHHDTQEVVQDVFIKAYRSLSTFRVGSSLSAWLYIIARSLAFNRLRYWKRNHRDKMISIQLQVVPGSKATFEDLLVVEQYSPEKETDSEDYLAFVESSIGNLRKNHREILTSLNAGNSTYEKIASDLGLSLGSVKSRIYRARECLNRLLKYREENIDMT